MSASFKVLSLTDRAADRIKAIMADADRPIAGLRVGVRNGGCAGMSYTMEYAEAVKPAKSRRGPRRARVRRPQGGAVPARHRDGLHDRQLSSKFVFNNPNQVSACGCGKSVAITPARGPPAAPLKSRTPPP